MTGTGRVVVGVSGSLRNVAAIAVAERLARTLTVPLVLVTAWQPYGGEITARRTGAPALDELYRDQARDRLRESLPALEPGTPAQAWVVRGLPGPTLTHTADQANDLLVIGKSRRNLLARGLETNVERYCLRHARCPVHAVPVPDLLHHTGRLPRTVR